MAPPGAASPDPAAERVLDAADQLLRQSGTLTLDEVAKRSGVSRTTLYRLFGSRAGLLEALERRGGGAAERAGRADPPSARERILDALVALVRDRTLGQVTVDEIAQTAGVSAVTVYRVFGDKDGLVRTFMDERTPRSEAMLLLGDHEAPIADVLRTFGERILVFMRSSRGLFLQVMLGPPEERAYVDRMRRTDRGMRRAVAAYLAHQKEKGVLRDDLDVDDGARAYLGLLFAFGVIDDVGPEAADRAVEAFLRGALRERSRR